jgi:hypothetical protein
MGKISASPAEPVGQSLQPWYYGAARLIARIAVVIAIVNVIIGVAVGVEASRYETDSGETAHHAGVLALSIISGAMGAMLWVALAAALLLLVEMAESRKLSVPQDQTPSGTGS